MKPLKSSWREFELFLTILTVVLNLILFSLIIFWKRIEKCAAHTDGGSKKWSVTSHFKKTFHFRVFFFIFVWVMTPWPKIIAIQFRCCFSILYKYWLFELNWAVAKAIGHFRIPFGLFLKTRPGANLNVNENLYESISIGTPFEKQTKGNSEMSY